MSGITQTLSSALLHFIWQGVLVAAMLWIALFLLRKRSPQTRYVVSCLALLVLALLPLVTLAALSDARNYPLPDHSSASALSASASSVGALPGAFRASWLALAQAWALPAWSIGVLLFSMRIVWGCQYVYILKRRGELADRMILDTVDRLTQRLGIHRPVRVLMSSIADGPGVVGWLRPVVLLPASSLMGLSPEQLEAVIAHELAHVRRHDYVVSAFQVVVETLLFYHPAVWWTSSRIRHERELCCDDLAVRACGDAICYARALTKLEKLRLVSPGMVLGATDGSLLYRIQRIIGEKTIEYGPSKLSGAFVVLLALAGLAVNVGLARSETKAQEAPAVQGVIRRVALQTKDQTGVSVDLGAASILHRTNVEYPETAIAKGIQGNVAVEATLDIAGNVVDARVLSGPTELRRSALQSILQWHFQPNSAQNTRVVNIVFDLAAAKQAQSSWHASVSNFGAITVTPDKQAAEEKAREGELQMAYKQQIEAYNKQLNNEPPKFKIVPETEGAIKFSSLTSGDQNIQAQILAAEQKKAEEQLVQVRAKLLESELEKGQFTLIPSSNAVVTAINTGGLSDQVRADLLSRLPIQVGDSASPSVMEKATAVLHDFDEHLQLRLVPAFKDGANGVELQIVAPGSGAEPGAFKVFSVPKLP